jgi:cytochrome c1
MLLVCTLLLAGCRTPAEPHRAAYSGDASRAPALLKHYGCAGCHLIPGVPGAKGVVGPPLWAMGDRVYIAGVLPNTEADMVRWLISPRQVNPLTAMPDTGLTERDARDITAFLATLRAESTAMRMLRGYAERALGRHLPEPWMPPSDEAAEP